MFEKIKDMLIETANVDYESVTKDARLKEDLHIDSLYAVELILSLETTFDIKVEWEEMTALKTVDDVCKLVESKIQK